MLGLGPRSACRPGVFAAVVVVVVLGSMTACGGKSAQRTSEGVKSKRSYQPLHGGEPKLDQSIIDAADPLTAPRPLSAYVPQDEVARTTSRAMIIVGNTCMRQFGFEPDPGWKPEGALPIVNWVHYGLWDSTHISTFGYSQPPSAGENTTPIRFFMNFDAQLVYMGQVSEHKGKPVPPGGCQKEEMRIVVHVNAGSKENGHLITDLVTEANSRALADSRVAKLQVAWKTCVKNAGWDYPDPVYPFQYWENKRGSDKSHSVISEDEKAAAKADMECKRSTKFLGTWLAADLAYQKILIQRDSAKLDEYNKNQSAMLAKANEIIAKG